MLTSVSSQVLTVRGNQIVNADGQPVVLRGFGLGGWMNMENFITGYPANEQAQREALRDVLGDELCDLFFDRFLEYFFTEDDARYISSLGLNLVRLPLNYRHFEDDMNPFVLKEEGFKHLDRAIEACARHKLYTILDLHALPGYQNQHWHSDNPTHVALFWEHKHFQDRAVWLWERLAERYKGNPWVAGYNVMNEPADPKGTRIEPIYSRFLQAIRAIEPDHILFLEGNRYSNDFHMFGEPLPNVVYTNHDYALSGFVDAGPYPGISRGEHVDRDALERKFRQRSEYMLEYGIPIWVGEFGPIYTGEPSSDAMRFQVLRDQLEIYCEYSASWAIWTYKDIGLQGVVYAAPDSAWMERVRPIVEKKRRLGADSWGTTDAGVREVIGPIEDLFAREFPNYNPFPFGTRRHVAQLVRHILLSEPLLQEWAERFRGVTADDIDRLMQSFLFENCCHRSELAQILASYA
ncbi:MAG: glycoside hydrolase family 5 protein [Chloroflexota bacterium]|nr:glycoside hydrolase family 5 protein [Chloroflexota bacterium]